jgi:hypothetical protein
LRNQGYLTSHPKAAAARSYNNLHQPNKPSTPSIAAGIRPESTPSVFTFRSLPHEVHTNQNTVLIELRKVIGSTCQSHKIVFLFGPVI